MLWLVLLFAVGLSDGANLVHLACRMDPKLPYCGKQEISRELVLPDRERNSHLSSIPTGRNDEGNVFWPEQPNSEELFTGYNIYLNQDNRSNEEFTEKGVKYAKTVNRVHAVPIVPSDARYTTGGEDAFKAFDQFTDSRGVLHRPKSSSPFSKPGLWEPNPADPHSRDPANKYWYHPESVGVDWLNGQLQWGAHWAVPAAGIGGTDGMSTLHFPSIGQFFNIPDDYD